MVSVHDVKRVWITSKMNQWSMSARESVIIKLNTTTESSPVEWVTHCYGWCVGVTSLRASSPIWTSEASLARTCVLARLASLAQIGGLARRLRCNQLQISRLIFQASDGKHEVAVGERRAPDTCDLRGTLPSCVSGTPRPLRLALVVAFLKHKMRSKLDGVCGWLRV